MKPKNDYPNDCEGCEYFGTYWDEKSKMEVPSQPNATWKGCAFNEKPSLLCHKGMQNDYELKDRWVEA